MSRLELRLLTTTSTTLFSFLLFLYPSLCHTGRVSAFRFLPVFFKRKPPIVTNRMSTTDQDVEAYARYASLAVDLSQAHISDQGLLTVTRSVRDIDSNKRRRFLYSMSVNEKSSLVIPPTQVDEGMILRLPSLTGRNIAVFRKNSEDDKATILEVWTDYGHTLTRRIPLPKERHSKLIVDEAGFGGPAWNPDETALVYVAERKPLEATSFFAKPTSDPESGKTVFRGGKNTLGIGQSESWGEKYSGQSALLDLFVCNVTTGKTGKVENVPTGANDTTLGGYTLGQPVWSPDGQSIVYTAWDAGGGDKMPRRLGLIYCQNRACQLYASNVQKLLARLQDDENLSDESPEESFLSLTPGHALSRSPRFGPASVNGTSSRLVFLSNENGFDTHSGCFGLYMADWNATSGFSEPSLVVPVVVDPRDSVSTAGKVSGLGFPGLFLQNLPETCFVTADSLLLTTQWGCTTKVVKVNLKEACVTLLQVDVDPTTSDSLLCISPSGDALVQSKRSNMSSSLKLLSKEDILQADSSAVVSGRFLSPMSAIAATSGFGLAEPVLDFRVEIVTTTAPDMPGVDFDLPVQSILLLPKKSDADDDDTKKLPLIVVPHGGPHSASVTSYLPSYAFLAGHSGYAILLVNYRGSTGFGQASIQSLPGQIGSLDVQDVMAALQDVLRTRPIDPTRVAMCGGSHGGFLTAHCTGQYPDVFKAAALRNPVVNLPSMTTATDIPDWCYVEGGLGDYDWTKYRPATGDEIAVLYRKSPVQHVDKVVAPTLVSLGLKDLRVPPSQGLEWYHSVRSRQVACKLLQYEEDDHAIAGVAAEADHWINIKQWFDHYLG